MADMSRYREFNSEVFYTAEALALVGDTDVAALRDQAAENPRERSRLCLHENPDAPVHEMLIVHRKGVYVRPHRHSVKPESLLVLSGCVTAIFHDDEGRPARTVAMGPAGSGRAFYYRIPPGQWHSLLIDEDLVFMEVVQGPFAPGQSEFPAWAPDGADPAAVQAFQQRLRNAIPALGAAVSPA
jgi:cupin fold WbuC family metalloprotein